MSQIQDIKPIVYWNRARRRLETEQVYGDRIIRWLYDTRPGRHLSELILSRSWISKLYGLTQDSRQSSKKIPDFIRQFSIPMEEYENPGFQSFNEFFTRKFKAGARTFEQAEEVMPAFAEARYFAFDQISVEQTFPIKGAALSAEALIGDAKQAKPFIGGPLLLARLCPVDYHRFHFPDDGEFLSDHRMAGPLHSVNPLAIQYKGEILSTNERHVSILKTANFGLLAYIEVGALCVGKIVQSHPGKGSFKRGDEKGYFLFGGSTVIVLGEPNAWKPDADLLEQTHQGRESLVRLGERVAGRP